SSWAQRDESWYFYREGGDANTSNTSLKYSKENSFASTEASEHRSVISSICLKLSRWSGFSLSSGFRPYMAMNFLLTRSLSSGIIFTNGKGNVPSFPEMINEGGGGAGD